MSADASEKPVIFAYHRLALGIEPIDHATGNVVAQRLQVEYDERQLGLPRPALERHPNGRYSLRYREGVGDSASLRIFDPSERLVPRRLRIPIRSADQARLNPAEDRIRRPVLFPGPAYAVVSRATGVRGRIRRGERPVRWARLVARSSVGGSARVVGRAQSDRYGQFLLVIHHRAAHGAELVDPIPIAIEVHGPAAALPVPADDELGDVPVEDLPAPGSPDDVSPATAMPPGFGVIANGSFSLDLTHMRSRLEFTIP